jgi:glycosyltransferase involved in cell wall biosynthesis
MKREVVIAVNVFNEEVRLPRLLESVKSQTYPHLTLFISDNHSTDRTPNIVEAYSRTNSCTKIVPPTFLPLQEHLIFMIETIVSRVPRESLVFFLGADDYFLVDTAIEELVNAMQQTNLMIVNPVVRIVSPNSAHYRDSRSSYPSRIRAKRLICLSLENVSTGVQVHHSLMSLEVFEFMGKQLKFWYTREARRDRNGFAEYMTLWEIVERYSVVKCPQAIFVKEINNRVDSSVRKESAARSSIGFRQVLRMHLYKNLSTLLMIRKRQKVIGQSLVTYQICAIVSFFRNCFSDIRTLLR